MESMLISNNKRSLFIYEKNTFLYIVIAVLVIALAGLGALNVRSLDKLASLQTKLTSCRKVCRRFLILPLSSAAKPISWMLFILMILPFPALLPQHLQLRSRVLPYRKNPQIHLQPPILPTLPAARTVLLPLRKKEHFPHPAEALSQTIQTPVWTTF